MRKALPRLLRLRSLLEEESRIKLEKLARRASLLESARERQETLASARRWEAFSLLSESAAGELIGDDGSAADRAATEEWMTAVSDRDIAQWREKKLAAVAEVAAKQVEAGREAMFRLRRERQQVEAVIRNEAALRKIELERRQQRDLDDWFAAIRDRQRRSARNRNASSGS